MMQVRRMNSLLRLTTVNMAVTDRVDLVLRFTIGLLEESGGDLVSPGTETIKTARKTLIRGGFQSSEPKKNGDWYIYP